MLGKSCICSLGYFPARSANNSRESTKSTSIIVFSSNIIRNAGAVRPTVAHFPLRRTDLYGQIVLQTYCCGTRGPDWRRFLN